MRGFAFSVLIFVVAPTVAEAAPSTRACAVAYEETQIAMRRSRLLEAREKLQTCLHEACPKALRVDCGEWLKEVEARTPSVVIECVADGAAVRDARLFVDEAIHEGGVDGRAIALDPGPHVFRIEAPHVPPVSTTTIIREGEKLRVVRIEVPAGNGKHARAPLAPANEQLAPERPVSWPVYVFAGVGAAAAAGFVTFAASGAAGKSDLYPCKPECPETQISDVRTKFLVADVFLGVSVIALGAAAYLFLTRPTVQVPTRSSEALTVDPSGVRLAF